MTGVLMREWSVSVLISLSLLPRQSSRAAGDCRPSSSIMDPFTNALTRSREPLNTGVATDRPLSDRKGCCQRSSPVPGSRALTALGCQTISCRRPPAETTIGGA